MQPQQKSKEDKPKMCDIGSHEVGENEDLSRIVIDFRGYSKVMAPPKYACPSCYVLKYAKRIVETGEELLESVETDINDLETCIKRLHGLTTKENEPAGEKEKYYQAGIKGEPKTEFDAAMQKGRIYDNYERIAFDVLGSDPNAFFSRMVSLKEDLEKKRVAPKAECKTYPV